MNDQHTAYVVLKKDTPSSSMASTLGFITMNSGPHSDIFRVSCFPEN